MDRVAKLALEDGTVFTGTAFGADGEVDGEVVFNTSMTGYQEILTDPSYRGQIVTMTYPEIGNYGVNPEDVESQRPHLAGFVCKENSRVRSNFRSTASLESYLNEHGIVALEGIDTRKLVRILRTSGAMKGVITTVDLDDESLVAKARQSPGLVGRDLVREVMPTQPVNWNEKLSDWWQLEPAAESAETTEPQGPHVVAMDFGMKWNIARHLYSQGFRVTGCAREHLGRRYPGASAGCASFCRMGPVIPSRLITRSRPISELLGKVPMFGICLGHQLMALACGAKTFKLKFGHRGSNQPVIELDGGKVEITRKTMASRFPKKVCPRSSKSPTAISMTTRLRGFAIEQPLRFAFNIILRLRQVPTTASTCSIGFVP